MTKLGFIGYGIMGERLLRAALAHDPATIGVAGAWDPSRQAMARLARDLPMVPRMATAESLIAVSDCIYIASPPATHHAHAVVALKAGKAVFCEKPLAVDAREADELVALAGKGRAAVNFPFASSFAVDQLRRWLDGIGRPRALAIELAFKTWPRPWQFDAASWLDGRAQGGFTREVGSHFLFLARRLLGALTLKSHRNQFPPGDGSEHSIEATLTAGAVPVTLTGAVGVTTKDDHNLWTLEGDKGAMRLRDWSIAEIRRDGAWAQAPDALPNEKIRPLVLARQLDKVAAMTQGSPHDLATFAEAADVQAVVEAILRTQEKPSS